MLNINNTVYCALQDCHNARYTNIRMMLVLAQPVTEQTNVKQAINQTNRQTDSQTGNKMNASYLIPITNNLLDI